MAAWAFMAVRERIRFINGANSEAPWDKELWSFWKTG